MNVENSIRLSRAFAAKHLAWFSPALYRCRIVLTDQISVAAIDKNFNTYWNPKTISLLINSKSHKKRALQEIAFIWIHEISHVLREHFNRASNLGVDSQKWNYAADLEINDSDWDGIVPPKLFPPIIPKTYGLPEGKTAEWYYLNMPNDYTRFIIWDDGSGVHDKKRNWEKKDKGAQIINDISRTVIRRDIARRLKDLKPGHIPGGWVTWIKNTLDPKVDWKKVLRRRLTTAITVGKGNRIDYTFNKLNRRSIIYSPFILPALAGTQNNQLTVVIDTSGSMSGRPIEQAVGELFGILKNAHSHVTLIPCDADVYKTVVLKSIIDLKKMLSLPGGGGTNMIKGIEFATGVKPTPDTILVLTDGYTPYPRKKYKIPVLFGIIRNNQQNIGSLPMNPPWGLDSIVFIELD